ncbi:maleylpyruvate isomerase family mycothiol-dependent enzyme [Nocardioides sp. BP30]|uniref:maleylpyruvate isomerase family mycothiol-dependent enzyme n=1 Tax=Nocardioides sp. BP30 TaxID=3036374 RepID=UPI00246911A2|nr:maleylpyruvate isomerase family mycothiol-dependent enzyme [Nocardioides sp. BP30]WGL54215.1 maleylpyruvate isomerase family mycothiol-dependent enzyme [Nocardioides sp. BP30]
MSAATEADQLRAASRRLVRTVDALSDDDWAAPSRLPGWSRAHVVAHLALNAEGLAGAVTGAVEGRPVPMYVSDERRDGDIEALAVAAPDRLRDRLFGGVTTLLQALALLAQAPEEVDAAMIDRTPGGRRFPVARVATMRWREVEIHHVDLGRGYSPADWPAEFSRALLEETARRHRDTVDATVVATDLDWTLPLGSGRPTVTGAAHGLAWWLTGRAPYPGAEVTSESGVLPRIEAM